MVRDGGADGFDQGTRGATDFEEFFRAEYEQLFQALYLLTHEVTPVGLVEAGAIHGYWSAQMCNAAMLARIRS